jgi:F-type H+-transporting ATPase subunit gamma
MSTSTPNSISIRTRLGFEECLNLLRQKLRREQFRVAAEIQIDREFENNLGVRWGRSAVLAEIVLTKLMEALSGLNAAPEGPLRITVFHHRADKDDVSISVLRPFREADGEKYFAYPPLLNLEPQRFLAGLAEEYLSAMLFELLYSSLMAENQRRIEHMDSAVQRLDRTVTDLLLRRNAMRHEEITEEIEIIMLSIEALDQEHRDYEG